jgi:membrane protein implicated in regulation of membrane protease activity
MKTALWWGAGLLAVELGLVLMAVTLMGHEVVALGFIGAVAAIIAQLLGAILLVSLWLIPVVLVVVFFVRRMPSRMVDRDPRGEGLR